MHNRVGSWTLQAQAGLNVTILGDILYSRVSHDPDWGVQAQILTTDRKSPRLINKWPLPDLPDPALRRILIGRADRVRAVAIAPDGVWLATGPVPLVPFRGNEVGR